MAPDGKEDILRKAPTALNVPPMLVQPGVEKLDTPVTMPDDNVFPDPTFTTSRCDAQKRRMPQCIAHRGYKAAHPENTMAAFKGAVEEGVHALETDVHITKDEVVVLSHDATLKRCFGRNDKIIDKTWKEIEELRTIVEPHEGMPKLQHLLEYLAQPGLEEIWLLLDIKLDNDADAIMRLIGSTIASVAAPANAPWKERIVLGVWAAKYLPLAMKYLPGFPVTHIGFSIPYARHFFNVPNVSFNMLLPMLLTPSGRRFIRDARQKHHRPVYAWTVNERDKMEWCIRRHLDAVITDDPREFLRVCRDFDEYAREPFPAIRLRAYWDVLRLWMWVSIASWFFGGKFRPVASEALIKRAREEEIEE